MDSERSAFLASRTGLLFILFLLLPALLWGQYFGKNKVEYKPRSFSVLTTPHFLIYHYPAGAPAIRDASRMLENAYSRLEQFFGYDLRGPQKEIVYNSFLDFQQTNAIPDLIPQGEGGVTESLGNRIVLYLTGIHAEDAHVLAHELVHAFQISLRPSAAPGLEAPQQLPLWIVEGMAELLSVPQPDAQTNMWMRDAVLNRDIPSIDQLSRDSGRYFPYRFGEAALEFVQRTRGADALRSLFVEASTGGIAHGVQAALGMDTAALSKRWSEDLSTRWTSELAARTPPQQVGSRLAGAVRALSLSPVVSPDGKFIALFTQREPFSLDLVLVDASTGKLIRTLASSNTDAHFDALNFVDSSGTWSPDGLSFAFVVSREGASAIAIVDAATGKLSRVIPFGDLDGISSISWSPDGGSIAMSATKDAVRDLYLYRLQGGTLQQLTTGWHAEIQPAWSPDGKTIAFATDEGSHTDLGSLRFDSMNIALLDVQTGQMRTIALRDGAHHINPQFSPDGKSLYFVSDPDGFPDLYRYDLEGDRFFRVTRVSTGISGLTAFSPCMSVSSRTGAVVFTVFNHRSYEVHSLSSEQTVGTPVSPAAAEQPSAGPPSGSAGAPGGPGTSLDVAPYKPSLSLVSVGQAALGLSLDPFGPSVGAVVEMLFQDVLGNHELDTAAQITGALDTLGAQVLYTNRARRLGWGISVGHIPQPSLYFVDPSQIPVAGVDTSVASQETFTDQVSLLAQYPFSANRRLEAAAGYELIWQEPTAMVSSYAGGDLVDQRRVPASTLPPLSLVNTDLAYVGDYSFEGLTDPVSGYRYRLDLQQTLGSLDFLTALVDARAYLFLKPLTVAFRVLHMGRYLGDSESALLSPFYLGYPDLVRGYDASTFTAGECPDTTGGGCPAINRLFGSRIAVANAELRLPILGTDQFGLVPFPYLPTTLVGFLDAGVAWTSAQPPVLELSTQSPARIPVISAGVALRFNLLGALVFQIYYAYPFQRPLTSGSFGLVLEEGW